MLDTSSSQKILDAPNWTAPLDQHYHPTGKYGQDSIDVVYNCGDLNKSRMIAPVLIKEWFFLVQPGGHLIIDYHPNKWMYWQELERYFWWLWKDQYEVLFHGAVPCIGAEPETVASLHGFVDYWKKYNSKNIDPITLLPPSPSTVLCPRIPSECMRFVCRKKTQTTIPGDSIDKWTFGIITNGKRNEWIEQIIQSIRQQKISNYEIIICGTYFDRKEKDVRYIPFNQRDDIAWISKKKNMIAQAALYENIFIIHDRVRLVDHWYEDMREWGNCFEFLFPLSPDYQIGGYFGVGQSIVPMHIKTTDWCVSNYSAFIIAKKSVFSQVLFRETAYWGGNCETLTEDVTLAHDLSAAGFIFRNSGKHSLIAMSQPRVARGNAFLKRLLHKVLYYWGSRKARRIMIGIMVPFGHLWEHFSRSSTVTKKVRRK